MAGVTSADIATVPLFASLGEPELADVAGWFEVKEVGPGVRLIGEGATGYAFFVLVAGGVEVTASGERLASLGPSEFFGEVALLGKGRRTATVTTTAPSRVLVMFGEDFSRLRTEYPAVAGEIDATMARRLDRA